MWFFQDVEIIRIGGLPLFFFILNSVLKQASHSVTFAIFLISFPKIVLCFFVCVFGMSFYQL